MEELTFRKGDVMVREPSIISPEAGVRPTYWMAKLHSTIVSKLVNLV